MSAHDAPAYTPTLTDKRIIWTVETLQGNGRWAGFNAIVQRLHGTMDPGFLPDTARMQLKILVDEGYLTTNGSGWRRGDRLI